ncbi:MAG: RNA-binding protein [Pedosphaera sp.]|nr:RNA-binding protein [Pedosphaera sp.]
MSTKLYVGNLSFNTTENDLQDLFTAHGPVTSVDMIMDKMSGRPRGFGFVTMESSEGATAAIAALHGKNVDGRDLTVNEARPREERPRSFSGGGAGGGGGGDRGPRRDYNNRY